MPAASVCGIARQRPASENLHNKRHMQCSKKTCLITSIITLFRQFVD